MFRIGDFARVGQVSVRMLHHYDGIGLLRPAQIDSNGYRLYSGAQLTRLNRIVALKDLGFSLETVSEMLDSELSVAELRRLLERRRLDLEQQIADYAAKLESVEARLKTIESVGVMSNFEVILKSLPALNVAELTATAGGFTPEFITPVIGPLYDRLYSELAASGVTPTGPGLAYYEEQPDGSVIIHAAAQVGADVSSKQGSYQVVVVPAVENAATLVHQGLMDNVMPAVQGLARWVDDNGWVSEGDSREYYLDYGMSEDSSSWITELQEPVRRA